MLLLTFRADAGAALFWLLAFGAMLYIPRTAWKELPALALLATGAVTLVIFGSPGTSVNHLIDLHVIAVVFFVAQFARGRIPAALGMTVLSVAALLSVAGSVQLLRDGDNANRRDRFAKTIRALRDVKNPLFEIPTVPVIAGERPYMTDPYMFSVIGTKHPEVTAAFLAQIDRREFGAIVCIKDPGERMGREWFDTAYFGKGFIEHVLANYETAAADARVGFHLRAEKSPARPRRREGLTMAIERSAAVATGAPKPEPLGVALGAARAGSLRRRPCLE